MNGRYIGLDHACHDLNAALAEVSDTAALVSDRRPAGNLHSRRDGDTPRQWVIAIPPGTVLLNMNDRMHHMKRNRLAQVIKSTAGWQAKSLRIPHLDRVHAYGLLHAPDKRQRDPGNWALTQKAAIDGIVQAGVLVNDHAEILTDLGIRLGEPGRVLAYSLVITEVIA